MTDREQELLAALKEIEDHCPCGARPESPRAHPHVIGCPVERAIRLASADASVSRAVSPEQQLQAEKAELIGFINDVSRLLDADNIGSRNAPNSVRVMTDPRSELERLVATWRARAVAERASGREPAAIPGMRRAIGDGIAAVYDQHADQLSAILQRSPQQEEEKDEKT